MDREFKTISTSGVAEALAKVQHYRYLNQAEEAESICRDILAADPENQMALRQLGLAITDQFTGGATDRRGNPGGASPGNPGSGPGRNTHLVRAALDRGGDEGAHHVGGRAS